MSRINAQNGFSQYDLLAEFGATESTITAATASEAITEAAASGTVTAQPKKLPDAPTEGYYTVGGAADTEYDAAYRALANAARHSGIADPKAQARFAESIIGAPTEKNKANFTLEYAGTQRKVTDAEFDGMKGQVKTLLLSRKDVSRLRAFRQQYVRGGGEISSNQAAQQKQTAVETAAPRPEVGGNGAVGGADAITDPFASPTKTFQVVLPNDGKPNNADRVLLYHIQDKYKGGNLWGPHFAEIRDTAKAAGVTVQNQKHTPFGNQTLVEFKLTRADILKLDQIRAGVQDNVNQTEAVANKFRQNNELASFVRGMGKGAWNSLEGTWKMVTDIPGTVNGLWKVVTDIPGTYAALKKELGETWDEFKKADPSKKSEMLGELIGAAVVDALLGKGVGKAASILKKTKTGQAILSKADDLAKQTGRVVAGAFSDEAAEAASRSIAQKMRASFGTPNLVIPGGGPIDPKLWADLGTVAGNRIQKGAVKFADFAKRMVDEFGDAVKPHVEKLYRETMQRLERV